MEAGAATVKAIGVVSAIVAFQVIGSIINGKFCILNTVGMGAYNSSHVKGFFLVALGSIKA